MSISAEASASVEERELLARIDAVLSIENPPTDPAILSRTALDMCQIAKFDADPELAAAIDVAARYWAGLASESERLQAAEYISGRGEGFRGQGKQQSAEWSANQLVLWALDNKTAPTAYAAEFIVEFGRGAGISIETIRGALSSHIPELSAAE